MIVFIAGMPRSGSTFAFNMARDALKARGRVYQDVSPNILEELSKAGNAEHVLIKAHSLDDASLLLAQYGATRVICTIRNPENAVASLIEMFDRSEDEAISNICAWLNLYRRLKPFALTVNYMTIDRHPWIAAWRIMRFLFADATVIEAWRASRRCAKAKVKMQVDALDRQGPGVRDVGFSWYDEETLFHRRHVRSLVSRSAVDRLSADQVTKIRAALAGEASAAGLQLD